MSEGVSERTNPPTEQGFPDADRRWRTGLTRQSDGTLTERNLAANYVQVKLKEVMSEIV
jgi:hypothetical protein